MLDTLGQSRQQRAKPPIYAEYSEATATEDDCHDLGQDIVLALARLPAGSADFAVPPLLSLWQGDRQFYEAALAAALLTFPAGGRPVPSGLSEVQRSVLTALIGDSAIWTFCVDTAPILAARGLPGTRSGMQAFLRSGSGRA
jgi:hypothetical protein